MAGLTLLRAALAYFAAIFALGFVLGAIRVTWLVPSLGELAAVAIELPVMLAVSWWWAGRVLNRWPLPRPRQRLAMGATAFAILMAAELALAMTLGGQGPGEWLASMAHAAGMLGLAGQVLFALVPRLRTSRGS